MESLPPRHMQSTAPHCCHRNDDNNNRHRYDVIIAITLISVSHPPMLNNRHVVHSLRVFRISMAKVHIMSFLFIFQYTVKLLLSPLNSRVISAVRYLPQDDERESGPASPGAVVYVTQVTESDSRQRTACGGETCCYHTQVRVAYKGLRWSS